MRMLAANFLKALCYVLNFFLTIFIFIFTVRLAVAWAGPEYIFELIGVLTEAGVGFTGRMFHLPTLQFDIRPLFTIAILLFLRFFIVRTFSDMSERMGKSE